MTGKTNGEGLAHMSLAAAELSLRS
jgi:hypothetical protein